MELIETPVKVPYISENLKWSDFLTQLVLMYLMLSIVPENSSKWNVNMLLSYFYIRITMKVNSAEGPVLMKFDSDEWSTSSDHTRMLNVKQNLCKKSIKTLKEIQFCFDKSVVYWLGMLALGCSAPWKQIFSKIWGKFLERRGTPPPP